MRDCVFLVADKNMEYSREQRSSARYREIAGGASVRRCVDPAFLRLRDVLAAWFPRESA